ncbi:hypothetical protein BH10PLA1_BH10PLA1_10530 [soil metagenome]
MNKQRNAFKAGLFIIISITLMVRVIVGIEGLDRLTEPVQRCTVTFRLGDNLSGLDKGDDVRVGGVKVGKVTHIEYVPASTDGKPILIVHFHIPKKYDLHEDAQISIESTVTGAANLNIASLGMGAPLPEKTALIGRTGGIGALLVEAHEAINDFKQTSEAATATVKQVQGHVDPVVKKYSDLADRGSEMMVNIRDMIGQSTQDWKGTMANLNASTLTIKDKLPAVLDEAKNVLTKVQTTIDSATVAMEDVKKTAANARDVTGSARGILISNRAKFDGILASLKTAGDNVKYATSELRRSPWRLLYRPNPADVDNLTLFDSARQFSEGANDMNDAVQALRDAVNSGDLPPEELQKKIDLLDRSFNKFTEVEQKLWKNVKE